jgi:dihydropteroate synthase
MIVRCGNARIDCGRPVVMGILNVTPDSFSDGGRFLDCDDAVACAREMVSAGADIIDIGGESSRPGAEPVSAEEEAERVLPVIEAVTETHDIPVSIDTVKSEVAEKAIAAGASLVNDITALGDPDMASVVRDTGTGIVLMHMQGTPRSMQSAPEYANPVAEVMAYLRDRAAFAEASGIARDRIMVDPGIGFGKTLAHNIALIRDIGRFHELGYPVLVGVSRKSMIGMLTGADVDNRVWGTAALTAWCVNRGVQMHRVHDVDAMRRVCDMAAAVSYGAASIEE